MTLKITRPTIVNIFEETVYRSRLQKPSSEAVRVVYKTSNRDATTIAFLLGYFVH